MIPVGCAADAASIQLVNIGTAPLEVIDISVEGCGPEFILAEVPPLPVSIAPGDHMEIAVAFLPQISGLRQCDLLVESTDSGAPVFAAPLSGFATFEASYTDLFPIPASPQTDVLFVLDASGSMCPFLGALEEGFEILEDVLSALDANLQVGVIANALDDPYTVGRLVGTPRFLTSGILPLLSEHLGAVGCDGGGDQEGGLEAARLALTPPLAWDDGVPCACPQDDPCEAACAEGAACVGGGCGGYNRGFLRDGARLEIVFLSDSDDASPGPLQFYIDAFLALKGTTDPAMVHAHAVVGDAPDGCSNGAQLFAAAGNRYVEVQQAMSGVFASICDDDWAWQLLDVGLVSTDSQTMFFLSEPPVPGTITVAIDSGTGPVPCPDGWLYDPAGNVIVIHQAGACVPQPGDTLQVTYELLCNTP